VTDAPEAKFEILAEPEALARRAAEWLIATAAAKDGLVAIALSGGATPRRLYELLAAPPRLTDFPWARTHWFWGDERFVPRDSPFSNYRMVWEAMLSRAPVPPANIHAMPTGMSLEAAALAYERELKSFYGADRLDTARPLFDVTLLGLGPDGHTASLFPGSPVLAERQRWVAPLVRVTSEPRLTLTYPVLESSRHAAFLVAGAEKRAVLSRFRRGDPDLPAARLRPIGDLWVFSDRAAAGGNAK
jgi:6-phosphogluconolactonase